MLSGGLFVAYVVGAVFCDVVVHGVMLAIDCKGLPSKKNVSEFENKNLKRGEYIGRFFA